MRTPLMFVALFISLRMAVGIVPVAAGEHSPYTGGLSKSPETEFHFGAYGGLAFPDSLTDVKGRGSLNGVTVSDLKLTSGQLVGVKLGLFGAPAHKVARWFGLELDGSYLSSNLKAQTLGLRIGGATFNLPIDESKINFTTGALHLLLRYPGNVFQPYLGVGPAVIYARSDDITVGGRPVITSGSSTRLGFSGVGGFRLKFSDRFGVFFEYKHIRANVEFGSLEGDVVVHAGVVGMNFMF